MINWILNIIAAVLFGSAGLWIFIVFADIKKACDAASAQGGVAHQNTCSAAHIIIAVAAGLNMLWCGLSVYAIIVNMKAKANPSAVQQQQAVGAVVQQQHVQAGVVVGVPVQAQVVQAQVAQPAVVVGDAMQAGDPKAL
jgi:hypothetical protein